MEGLRFLSLCPERYPPNWPKRAWRGRSCTACKRCAKTAGFEIADYIVTYYQGDDYVKQVMTNLHSYVKLETLSRNLIEGKPEEGVATETFKLNDHVVVLGVKKV